MGKADTAAKAYTCQPDVFADAFNVYLYGGRQVLFPEQLRELDSTEFSAPFGVAREDRKYVICQAVRPT